MELDKDWRPRNWRSIKENVISAVPFVFSPSTGYSKDQKETIIEKTASALIPEILKELEDARPVQSGESESAEDRPNDESAWSGWGPSPTSQPPNSEPD